jgi:hypothetical protein
VITSYSALDSNWSIVTLGAFGLCKNLLSGCTAFWVLGDPNRRAGSMKHIFLLYAFNHLLPHQAAAGPAISPPILAPILARGFLGGHPRNLQVAVYP